MNKHTNSPPSQPVQPNFPGLAAILGSAPTTPRGVRRGGDREIEEKYLFYAGDNIVACQASHEELRASLHRLYDGDPTAKLVEHGGTDYYCNVNRDGGVKSFRFRTGKPSHWLLGVKCKHKTNPNVRKEIELQIDLKVPLESILDYMRQIASLDETFIESQVYVQGDIWNTPVPSLRGTKMEVVATLGRNLLTNRCVSTGEIEAHGFTNIAEAEREIRMLRKKLGWNTNQRCSQSTCQLLG